MQEKGKKRQKEEYAPVVVHVCPQQKAEPT